MDTLARTADGVRNRHQIRASPDARLAHRGFPRPVRGFPNHLDLAARMTARSQCSRCSQAYSAFPGSREWRLALAPGIPGSPARQGYVFLLQIELVLVFDDASSDLRASRLGPAYFL